MLPIELVVSQITPPVRILLIGAVVFLAAWFTVLRPKAEEVPPVTTPPVSTPATGLGKAVDDAKKAAGTESGSATAPQTAAPSATATPEAGVGAIAGVPATALAKLPDDVADALVARKVVVLGVLSEDAKPWRALPDDDRYVRNALARANRYDGRVLVKPVGLAQLSRYGALVNDLGVDQSPSVVVIDRNLQGTVLTGYVDTVAINQAIADARRNSIEPDIRDAYLRQANALCERYSLRMARWSLPTIHGEEARTASLERRLAIVRSYRAAATRVAAPARWRALRTAWLRQWRAEEAAALAAARGGTPAVAWTAADQRALDARFNAAGVTACAEARTL